MKELHKAIKLSEKALVSADPVVTSLGSYQQVNSYETQSFLVWTLTFKYFFQAHVFSSKGGGCAAFLSNYNTKITARVLFNNMHYDLPPWSISVLPDCRNAVYNTAKVCKMHRVFKGWFYLNLELNDASTLWDLCTHASQISSCLEFLIYVAKFPAYNLPYYLFKLLFYTYDK